MSKKILKALVAITGLGMMFFGTTVVAGVGLTAVVLVLV